MSAHTKGPWRFDEVGYVRQDSTGASYVYVASIVDIPYLAGGSPAATANGHLIAAAPELLEVLEDLVEAIPHQTSDADWWPDELTHAIRAARAAIAKAEVSQ